jgi:hypothetical protein
VGFGVGTQIQCERGREKKRERELLRERSPMLWGVGVRAMFLCAYSERERERGGREKERVRERRERLLS